MATRRAGADRRARALRWGNDERNLVDSYFRRGPTHARGLDPSRVNSIMYMRDLREQEALWRRHPQRNFNQNVRRRVSELQAEANYPGRAARPNPPDDEDEDEDDEDILDDDDDEAADHAPAADHRPRAVPPRRNREFLFPITISIMLSNLLSLTIFYFF